MSILLPNEKLWSVSNWIARGFYDDCLPHLTRSPSIASEIQFCVEADLDTLSLREATTEQMREFQALVEAVIEDNSRTGGRNFVDPNGFPIYMAKLQELKQLVEEVS